jgi:hypothetical protein
MQWNGALISYVRRYIHLRFGTVCAHSLVSEELNVASSTRTDFKELWMEKSLSQRTEERSAIYEYQ